MVSGADDDDETRVAKILADRWVHYPQGEAALTRMGLSGFPCVGGHNG